MKFCNFFRGKHIFAHFDLSLQLKQFSRNFAKNCQKYLRGVFLMRSLKYHTHGLTAHSQVQRVNPFTGKLENLAKIYNNKDNTVQFHSIWHGLWPVIQNTDSALQQPTNFGMIPPKFGIQDEKFRNSAFFAPPSVSNGLWVG
jgi:hypothetical protein